MLDLANDRLRIYNSGCHCDVLDIVEVPLSAPSNDAYLRTGPGGRVCRDARVILGS